jgi:very-short-patch-repair endonuclease
MEVSWNIKYRPDFWFVKENLVVEYDERAHQFQQDQDKLREKIIKRYIPNITFIRVLEGHEEKGLADIKAYMDNFNKINSATTADTFA